MCLKVNYFYLIYRGKRGGISKWTRVKLDRLSLYLFFFMPLLAIIHIYTLDVLYHLTPQCLIDKRARYHLACKGHTETSAKCSHLKLCSSCKRLTRYNFLCNKCNHTFYVHNTIYKIYS